MVKPRPLTSKHGGKVIVEEGRRITARHIRQLEKAEMTELEVPAEYLLACRWRKTSSNEGNRRADLPNVTPRSPKKMLAKALKEAGIKEFETLYTNDLDCGPFISDTLRIDPT